MKKSILALIFYFILSLNSTGFCSQNLKEEEVSPRTSFAKKLISALSTLIPTKEEENDTPPVRSPRQIELTKTSSSSLLILNPSPKTPD